MGGAPAIVAHRGASADHPENTVRAVVAALAGDPAADGFECDVRLTRDGVPVVFHDHDTRRLTGEPGRLEDRDLAAVRALRVRGEPVPTLAELLAAARPHLARLDAPLVNVELKPSNGAAALVAACRPLLDPLAADPSVRLVVSSFDARVLAAARRAAAPWRLAFLYEEPSALRFLALLGDGPLDLHPAEGLVDAAHLARLRGPEYGRRDARFRVWTVDDPARARELAALGVDAVITNVPAALKRALAGGPPDA